MSLNHEFLLLSARQHSRTDYLKWINHPDAIHIHDDVMEYLQDTMAWIICYNPAQKMMKHKGLNYHGPTVIRKDGAVGAEKLFKAWANLFSAGPKTIKLTGPYGWIQGKPKDTGSYSIITVNRDEIVKKLQTLARYSRSVARSDDELFLLHLGM